MDVVLGRRLPSELVGLVRYHGAAMVVQSWVRRRLARWRVKRVRMQWKADGRRRAAACIGRWLDSFALGTQPMSSPLVTWGEDLTWWLRYEASIVDRLKACVM